MVRAYFALALPLLCTSCAVGDPDAGTGPITLTPGVEASFQEYMARDAPLYFAVTEDGGGSFYVYCIGGVNCTSSAARMQVMDRCHRQGGRDCKIYAIGRSIVWQDAGAATGTSASATRAEPELSPSARLVRECIGGHSPEIRIQRCSEAIASADLAERDRRGPYYVRARAYEAIGNVPLAERDYQAVLTIDPNHAAARARLDRLLTPAAAPD